MALLVAAGTIPSMAWIAPFVAILLCIAIFPLVHKTAHWWEHNRNKLILALILGAITLVHYQTRGFGTTLHDATLVKAMRGMGFHIHDHLDEHGHTHPVSDPGLPATVGAFGNALFEYLPFIILLFSLYCVCGGIAVRGDIPAHPRTNTLILGIGGLLASFVGTTGAAMLLIRPLLQTNSERRHVSHTVIFFIFIVCNMGGCLLPIGDPPLFLGYLRGVPFLWTFHLWKEWAFMLAILLVIYYLWDLRAYRTEAVRDIVRDETMIQKVRIIGLVNLPWLIGVVLAVALLDPSKPVPGTNWTPPPFLREFVQLAFVALSFATTPRGLRAASKFNFTAIGEVACLFIGIFLTMQVPIEILNAKGDELGLQRPWHFFWATGILSSFLDNAPTYVVFFQTANAMTHAAGDGIFQLVDGNFIRQDLLVAISLGAVFMGANTYIGNGPNFMVKSIAEQSGVKMPSFFGYMIYSVCILVPLYFLVTYIFLI